MGIEDIVEEEGIVTPTEDGGVEVDLGGPGQGFAPEEDEMRNLVPSIRLVTDEIFSSYLDENKKIDGATMLKEMGTVVCEDFETDDSSRSQWTENTAKQLKLFTGFMEPKNKPWPGSSNVNLPFLTISCLQFQARAFDAIIPAKEVAKAVALGDEDIERAERVSKYTNYDLLYKMPGFSEGFDKTLLQLAITGSVFRKTYRDVVKGRNVSEYIKAEDFVVNYHTNSLEDAARKTHVLYMTKNEIRKRVNLGVFVDEAWDLGEGTETLSNPIKEQSDKGLGIEEPHGENNKPRVIFEQHRDWDIDGDGVAEPYVITVDRETDKVLRIVKRTEVDAFGKEQTIEYFTHYYFIPNPQGFYGLGFGLLLRHLNESGNTLMNIIIDAGGLANMQGGFVSKRSGIKKGALTFERGKYKEVDTTADDIRKSIFNFDFKGPDQSLFATLGLLFEYSRQVASISETMTGQMPASDTPATTVLALIEEGRKVFSAIHKRVHGSFGSELKKLFRLNSIFMNEQEYFKALGDRNIPQGPNVSIGKADFKDTIDVIPVSDPSITSRSEKVAKAQAVVEDVRKNPMTAQNNQANYVATIRLYKALEVPNPEELLKPPPPPPDLPPIEEHSLFLKERPAPVLPKQDHGWHLQEHDEFIASEFAERELTTQGKKIFEQHRMETIAEFYKVKEQEARQIEGEMRQQQEAMVGQQVVIDGGMPNA